MKSGGKGRSKARRSSGGAGSPGTRVNRVNKALKNELAGLLPRVRDPWVAGGLLTVSEVRTSADLSVARVFVSVAGDAEAQAAAVDGLFRASGFLRSELARLVRIRKVPELRFELDRSLEQAAHLDHVLAEIEAERRRPVELDEVCEVLRGAQRVLVTSHPSPDGDAIGSTIATTGFLLEAGKDVVAFNPDPVPHSFQFLAGAEAITDELPEGPFDVTVVLDCADPRMFPGGEPLDPSVTGTVLVIDHHKTEGSYGQLVYRDPGAASVGVMLYRVFEAYGEGSVSAAIAEALYTSILSDTGSFRYQNTNPEALHVAAELVGCGVDPWRVASNLYETRPREQLELLALVLNTLCVSPGGRAAALTVTSEMMEQTGCTSDMVDGFVNFARGLRGVEVAMLLRPTETSVRVSMRSRGAVDVSEIASSFGGGGHRNAAGCTIEGSSAEELRTKLFNEVERRVAGFGLELTRRRPAGGA